MCFCGRTLVLFVTGLARQSESYQTLLFFLWDAQGLPEQQTTRVFPPSRRSGAHACRPRRLKIQSVPGSGRDAEVVGTDSRVRPTSVSVAFSVAPQTTPTVPSFLIAKIRLSLVTGEEIPYPEALQPGRGLSVEVSLVTGTWGPPGWPPGSGDVAAPRGAIPAAASSPLA